MSYSEYMRENDYIHPDRATHGSAHSTTPAKHSLEPHSDRAFEYNNQSHLTVFLQPEQAYMVTTGGTWSAAGGETSRFQVGSGVPYAPPVFQIPRMPSSSIDSAGMAAAATEQHELYQASAIQRSNSQSSSAEIRAWPPKKNGTQSSRDKLLPQPYISYQPTALSPTRPVSTQTSNTQREGNDGWSEEPERHIHWRQHDTLIPVDHYDSSDYHDRFHTRKLRASKEASDITRHGSMDKQLEDPTVSWKRDQGSLSEPNHYNNHNHEQLLFQSTLTGADNSEPYRDPDILQPQQQYRLTNDRPTKKKHPNAFFIFSAERRQKIRDEQPKIRSSDMNRLLGQEWNSLSERSKMCYKQRSELLKEKGKESVMQYSIPASIISPADDRLSSEGDNASVLSFSGGRHHSLSNNTITGAEVCPSHHSAMYVSTSHDNSSSHDWQPSSNITTGHDRCNAEDTEADETSPKAIRGGLDAVSVTSHSGAAEAEALANLTQDGFQMHNNSFKRPQHRKNDRKPERLKRPPNAYLLFNRDMRHKILRKNANLSVAEISKLISERWSELSLEGKDRYNREAAKLKQQHMDNHPNFIYSRRSKAELAEAGYKSRPAKKRTAILSSKPLMEPKGRDPRGRKKKRLNNPTAPKHPMSGFLFYSTSVRAEVAASLQKASVGDISKVIASRWRQMDMGEREPWNRKAEEDKARYAREMEDFTSSLEDEARETQSRASVGGRVEGPRSPVELDSQTIATVAQMVNPNRESEIMLPPPSPHNQQYQVLPATPPHSGS